jgi:hypothetical protein
MIKCIRAAIGILYILAGLNCNSAVCAFELITKEEAGRPSGCPDRLRKVVPGPLITVLRLRPEMTSPISSFTIKLKAFAGASIDKGSLEVYYDKKPWVDLLPRISDSIEAQDSEVVIRIHNAQVPPGQHQIFVRVEDTKGRANDKYFNFCIINPNVAQSNCVETSNC